MANKRYDQFSSGTPAATDIILYANPSDGELKKTEISNISTALKAYRIYGNSADQNNVAGVDTDVYTHNIPANALSANGDGVRMWLLFESVTGGASKAVRVRLLGTEMMAISATTNGQYRVNIEIIRQTSSILRYSVYVLRDFSAQSETISTIGSVDFTAVIPFICRLQSSVANTVIGRMYSDDLSKQ